MALPGLSFIKSHVQSFFLTSIATVYRIDTSVADAAGGQTITRVAYVDLPCAIEESRRSLGLDGMEGQQPTNQQLFDLITVAPVQLIPTDEVVVGSSRYAVIGHTQQMTNEATARTPLKLLPSTVAPTPDVAETAFPGAIDTF